MDWRNTKLVLGDYLWCRLSFQYFLSSSGKKATDMLAPATLTNVFLVLEFWLEIVDIIIMCAQCKIILSNSC